MLKKMADRWVKALRSGKYKQGPGILYSPLDNTYCCLGVLSRINNCDTHGLSSLKLPSMQKSCGIRTSCGGIPGIRDFKIGGRMTLNLADANDNGVSFKVIANWIEKNYKKL